MGLKSHVLPALDDVFCTGGPYFDLLRRSLESILMNGHTHCPGPRPRLHIGFCSSGDARKGCTQNFSMLTALGRCVFHGLRRGVARVIRVAPGSELKLRLIGWFAFSRDSSDLNAGFG